MHNCRTDEWTSYVSQSINWVENLIQSRVYQFFFYIYVIVSAYKCKLLVVFHQPALRERGCLLEILIWILCNFHTLDSVFVWWLTTCFRLNEKLSFIFHNKINLDNNQTVKREWGECKKCKFSLLFKNLLLHAICKKSCRVADDNRVSSVFIRLFFFPYEAFKSFIFFPTPFTFTQYIYSIRLLLSFHFHFTFFSPFSRRHPSFTWGYMHMKNSVFTSFVFCFIFSPPLLSCFLVGVCFFMFYIFNTSQNCVYRIPMFTSK